MKKLLICAGAFLFTATMAMGQKTKAKPAAKTGTATSTSKPVMKSLIDSFSYAAGMNIAVNMKEQGISSINAALMAKAIDDVFSGKTRALTPELANGCLKTQMEIYDVAKKAEASKENVAPGQSGSTN